MGWLINDKAKMFGNRINIIDFLVLLFILCLIPMGFFAYKITTKNPEIIFETAYKVYRPCPVCGNSILIDLTEDSEYEEHRGILKGEPLPKFFETVCERCKNKVVLIRPRLILEETDYLQEYYKRMLEKGMP